MGGKLSITQRPIVLKIKLLQLFSHTHIHTYIHKNTNKVSEGACDIMVFVTENRPDDLSSNPGGGYLHFT